MRKNPGFSGGLIQLDTKEFGRFYGDLVKAFNSIKVAKLHLNKWVDKNGNGLLSPLGASALKSMIKNTIDGTKGGAPTDFAPLHESWAEHKDRANYYNKPWKFTGGVYKNIVATNRSGTYVVGIDRRARVKKIGFGRYNKGTISVEKYASLVEFGHRNIPERPLFSTVARHFISERIPEVVELVKKSFLHSKQAFEAYAGSSTSRGEMGGAVMKNVLGENIDVSKGMDPDKDFSEAVMRDAQMGAALDKQGIDKKQSAEIEKRDKQETKSFLEKNNIKKEDIDPEVWKILNSMV